MKAHEVVMKWVTDGLTAGHLSIGDRLPSERALAEDLGISRGSVREALRVLEALGALRTSTGSGPNSGTILTASAEQSLQLALEVQLAAREVTHWQVVETRMLMELWAASQITAASHDFSEAEALLERMDDDSLSVAEFVALDIAFHAALTRTAGNPLILTLREALAASITGDAVERAQNIPDWPVMRDRLRREHRGIFDAFVAGDSVLATSRVYEHITGYFEASAPVTGE